MSIVLDTHFVVAWLQPDQLKAPMDPGTGSPIENLTQRIVFMFAEMEKASERIILPAPVLAEFLVRADDAGPQIIAHLSKNKNFRLGPFGQRAAVEAASIIRFEKDTVGKSAQSKAWQQAKFDMQIVAIAKVEGARRIYTADQGLANICRRHQLTSIDFHELPSPPDDTLPLFKFGNSD